MQADSIEALERAALAGDWAAAARLGLNYLVGRQVAADPVRGIALIEQAARSGDALGAYLAAAVASTSFWRPCNWPAALDHLQQAAERGHAPAQSALRLLAAGPAGRPVDGLDGREMREAIDLAAWFTPPPTRLLRESPRIEVMEPFVPGAVCRWLIDTAGGRLARATIYDKATGGTTEDRRRTNSQCDLDIEVGGLLTFVIRGRIAAVTGRPDAAMEVPKVLHYRPGETFAEHFDYLDPDEPAYARELALRGQRTATFLIYLNDDFSGGETHFPELGLAHAGAAGDALVFSNVAADGQPDAATRHAGLPPTEGEKWLFSQWIREFPRN
ncbi:MAG TPA: 2OG-Fe(II) oxygenase [Woeseiaceae bacterium]|nr:2OG-Fe(II) oxygenase [Woeseiaceae bacterium]